MRGISSSSVKNLMKALRPLMDQFPEDSESHFGAIQSLHDGLLGFVEGFLLPIVARLTDDPGNESLMKACKEICAASEFLTDPDEDSEIDELRAYFSKHGQLPADK